MKCCNKEMTEENVYINGEDRTSIFCLKCGAFKTTISGQMDEEELENLRDTLN